MEWAATLVRLRTPMHRRATSLETLERRKLHDRVPPGAPAQGAAARRAGVRLTGAEIDEIDVIVRAASIEHGISVVMVEHRLELLALVASRVIVLDVGRGDRGGTAGHRLRRAGGARRLLRDRNGGRRFVTRCFRSRAIRRLRAAARAAQPRPRGRAGRAIGLVGLNGHGKSTLLRAIAGLTGWQTRLDQAERRRRSAAPACRAPAARPTDRPRGVALMPQGDARFPGCRWPSTSTAAPTRRAPGASASSGASGSCEIFPPLAQAAGQPVGHALRRRAAHGQLGRGLMGDATLLLVDEPSLGLAPKISKSVIEALMRSTSATAPW